MKNWYETSSFSPKRLLAIDARDVPGGVDAATATALAEAFEILINPYRRDDDHDRSYTAVRPFGPVRRNITSRMVMSTRRVGLLCSLVVLSGVLTSSCAPPPQRTSMSRGLSSRQMPVSETKLAIQTGTGEFESYSGAVGVDQPVAITLRWSTGEPGAAGGEWEVTSNGAVVASGKLSKAPPPGNTSSFTLPATTFLATTPPAAAKTYSIRIRALGAAGNALGLPSPAVVVTQGPPGTPITLDDDLGGAPQPFVEPGHPSMQLLSYRPLAMSWNAESHVVLELHNDDATPTSAVEVRVDDLQQVVRMKGPAVYAPALSKGQSYRISIPLRPAINTITPNGLPVNESEDQWKQRYPKGVRLLVGSSKIGSPYVQYQQPPAVTGPASACVGAGCATGSPPFTANLTIPELGSKDLNIAVSEHYVLGGDAGGFVLIDKRTREQLSLAGTQLAAHDTAIGGGGDATLFQEFWTGSGTKNLNKTLFPAGSVIPCDPANPISMALTPPPGIKMGPPNAISLGVIPPLPPGGKIKSYVYPSSSCINEFYDTRMTYDAERKRFWIVAHGRNQLWRDSCVGEDPKVAGAPPAGTCAKINALATRATVVAVSREEDPRKGFFTYHVATDYVDWPEMGLGGDYAVFNHGAPDGKVRFYDASKLAEGVKDELKPAFDASDFPGTVRIPHHVGGSPGVTYLVAFNGKSLSVYGLVSPANGVRPVLLGPATYDDPGGEKIGRFGSVYADGFLYFTRDYTGTEKPEVLHSYVRVWRVPVSFANGKIKIDSAKARQWKLIDPSLSLDEPTLTVTRYGDVLIGMRAYSDKTPNHARYAVLFKGEREFRSSEVLQAGSGTERGGDIDYQYSALDPSDGRTVWMQLESTKNVIGAVPLY